MDCPYLFLEYFLCFVLVFFLTCKSKWTKQNKMQAQNMLLFKLFLPNFNLTHAKEKTHPTPWEKPLANSVFDAPFFFMHFYFCFLTCFMHLPFFFSFSGNSLASNLFSICVFWSYVQLNLDTVVPPFFFFLFFISLILRAAAECIISFMSQPEAGNPCVPCLWILEP